MKTTAKQTKTEKPVNWRKKEEVLFLVYGTLKKGHGNNRLLKDAEFLGKFSTEPVYTLYDGGFPYVEREGKTAIQGELFKVTNSTTINNTFNLEGCSGIKGHDVTFYDFDVIDTPHGEAVIFCGDKGFSGRTKIVESGNW